MHPEVPPMTENLFEVAETVYLQAVEVYPDLPDVRMVITKDAGMEGRSYAYTEFPQFLLGISPRLLSADKDRQVAVLRHEMGHVVHESVGREELEEQLGELPESDERLADLIAEHIWGEPILYDDEEVQSIEVGVSPRPAHLG